jgi:ketosteroid isomerase-like protein
MDERRSAAEHNAEIARAAIDAISQGNRRQLSELLYDDVVWRMSEGTVLPTRMEGKRAIAEGFAPWFERKAGRLIFDELHVHGTAHCGIVEFRNHAEMVDGPEYRGEGVVVFEVRGDRIAEIREYLNPLLFNRVMPHPGVATSAVTYPPGGPGPSSAREPYA